MPDYTPKPPFSAWGAPGGIKQPVDSATLDYIRAWLEQNPPRIPISQISGFSSQLITGRVSSAGAVLDGTGFKAEKTNTAEYKITYSAPFSQEPVVLITLVGDPQQGGGAVVGGLTSSNPTRCIVQWRIVGGTDSAQAFDFCAFAIR